MGVAPRNVTAVTARVVIHDFISLRVLGYAGFDETAASLFRIRETFFLTSAGGRAQSERASSLTKFGPW